MVVIAFGAAALSVSIAALVVVIGTSAFMVSIALVGVMYLNIVSPSLSM